MLFCKIGFSLRAVIPHYASNRYVHGICLSGVYSIISDAVKVILARKPGIDWLTATAGSLYAILCQSAHRPSITRKYLHVNWERAFRNLSTVSPIHEYYHISYRAIHHILATGDMLRRYKLNANYACRMCGHRLETIWHIFFEYAAVIEARTLLSDVFRECGVIVPSLFNTVLFGDFQGTEREAKLVMEVVSIYKLAIWRCRNKMRMPDVALARDTIARHIGSLHREHG